MLDESKVHFNLHFFLRGGLSLLPGPRRIADAPDAIIARIPVNYTEAKVGNFTLPDVLKTFDGQPVTDVMTWREKRRPELLKFFETEYYGKVPATAPKVTWEVVSTDRNALEGKAIMKILAGHMGGADGPAISVTLYTPLDAKGPVPVLTSISFGGGGVRGGAGARAGRGVAGPARGTPTELISRGYGSATINYTSIETDSSGRGDANVNIARKLGASARAECSRTG